MWTSLFKQLSQNIIGKMRFRSWNYAITLITFPFSLLLYPLSLPPLSLLSISQGVHGSCHNGPFHRACLFLRPRRSEGSTLCQSSYDSLEKAPRDRRIRQGWIETGQSCLTSVPTTTLHVLIHYTYCTCMYSTNVYTCSLWAPDMNRLVMYL